VHHTCKPAVGLAIVFLSNKDILGSKNPFEALLISSLADAFGFKVPIPICEKALCVININTMNNVNFLKVIVEYII
jgi:hypothetical protein